MKKTDNAIKEREYLLRMKLSNICAFFSG